MTPFHELSPTAKLRRLRILADRALAEYGLDRPTVDFHGFETNLLYRVRTATGRRYMLRLASPGWRTHDDLRSEALWLEALARDTTIDAPRVIPTRDGRFVPYVSVPEVPIPWNVSLMTWVPGRLLGHYLTARNLERMGALFPELHSHAASWEPPADFTTRRFEHWLSRGEPNLLVGEASDGLSSADTRRTLERLHRHVEDAYAAIDRADLRVIHCDLWHDNIKLHDGRLRPFDFEDTVLGFRIHDIAMAMLDLVESTDDDRYRDLLAAFRSGYEAWLPWPDEGLEPFQIGRLLWKLNWIAGNQPQWLGAAVEQHLPLFETYERTGRLGKPPA
ncbi:MAG: phosphotransferase enzyme family protein [Spirochaetota bacterium]